MSTIIDNITRLIQDLSSQDLLNLRDRLSLTNDELIKIMESVRAETDPMSAQAWTIVPGEKKIYCIKIIREHTGQSLATAKAIAEGAPLSVVGWSYKNKEKFLNDLRANGSSVIPTPYSNNVVGRVELTS